MIHLRNCVPLDEILVGIVYILDYSCKVLQNRIAILGLAGELELIAKRGTSFGQVGAQRYVDLVQNVVVKVELVRADPWFFERIYAQSHD